MIDDVSRVWFGEQRLLRSNYPTVARLLYRLFGVADPTHWLHARYFVRALHRFPPSGPTRILDAGCGGGDYTFYLARHYPVAQVLGVDINRARIERNRNTAQRLGLRNVTFEVLDLIALRESAQFDLVVSVDVLEHIPLQQRVLENLARALKPGGLAFYHIPTLRERPVVFSRNLQAFHRWAEREHLAQELSAHEFASRVAATGIKILAMERTFGRYTGELATSLFFLFFEDTPLNRMTQGLLAPLCRLLALADLVGLDRPRYAVAVVGSRPPS